MAVMTSQLPTAALPTVSPAPPSPTEPYANDILYRLTVEQYHAMIRADILTEDDPVELLEGLLVQKMPKYSPHSLAKVLIRRALEQIAPSAGWYVDDQEPLTTDESEPEPDIYVVRGNPRDYSDRHPGPGDVALVGEVSDSTLRRDRGWKKRIYARAGVPVYWIVNLVDRQIEVYTDPTGPAEEPDYRQRQEYKPGDSIPVALDGTEVGRVNVSDVLP